jgi:hypothetical protein
MDHPRRPRGGYDDDDEEEEHASDDEGEAEEEEEEDDENFDDDAEEEFDDGDEFDDDDELRHDDGDDESYAILTAEEFTEEVVASLPAVQVDLTWIASIDELTDREVTRVVRALKEKVQKPCVKEEEKEEAGEKNVGPPPRAAASAGADHRGKDLTIQLRHSRHTMAVAKRTTKVLTAIGVVGALQSLSIHYEDDGEGSRALKFAIVDHYLASLSNSAREAARAIAPRPPLTVHLDCLGSDPQVWAKFVNRFPNMESLSLGNPFLYLHNFNQRTVAAVADSLHNMPALQSFTVNINVRGSSHTETVARLLRGMSAAPQLKTLCVQFDDDQDDEVDDDGDFDDDSDEEHDATELVDSINHLARFIATARFLRKFSFQLSGAAQQANVDCIALLDHAVGSTTLEEIQLTDTHLRHSSFGSQDAAANQSLKELTLTLSVLSPEFWSPLHRFENLRSVRLDNPRASQHRVSWSELFRQLPKLESFSDANLDDHRIDHDEEVAAIARNLDRMPLLRNLVLATHASPYAGRSVEFPSLEVLFQKCKGTLDLDHTGCGDDNVRFVCAGLNEARYLTHLHLRVTGLVLTPASVASIIGCLETNGTLQTFNGIFELSSPVLRGTFDAVLTSLLSANNVLTKFGLFVHDVRNASELGNKNMLLEPVVAGLALNETLKSISLAPFEADASFRAMLQKNATLQYVEGVSDPDIAWLLTLNRYKRRLLLTPRQLPESLWTRVLEQIVKDDRADVLFHFMKRLPRSITERIPS